MHSHTTGHTTWACRHDHTHEFTHIYICIVDYSFSLANNKHVYIKCSLEAGGKKRVNVLNVMLIHIKLIYMYCTTVFPSGILGNGTRDFGIMYNYQFVILVGQLAKRVKEV